MMGEEAQDVLLRRFLDEKEPKAASACLEQLLTEHVDPLVRDITGYRLRKRCPSGSLEEEQDEEDLRSEVLLQLITRLQELKRSPEPTVIGNFRGYVAATTYNAYHKSMRMKYPARWRLKNRIRYLLNHIPELSLWHKEHGDEYLCGLASWPKTDRGANTPSEQATPQEFRDSLPSGKNPSQMNLLELVLAFLEWWGVWTPIDELVGAVAESCNARALAKKKKVRALTCAICCRPRGPMCLRSWNSVRNWSSYGCKSVNCRTRSVSRFY
jgi:hypothetical protein